MAAPKRNKAQRERDLALVAELALTGLSAQLIADRLNARNDIEYKLTRQTVQRDIDENYRRYIERAGIPTEVHVEEQRQRIQLLYKTYYDGFKRSQENAARKRVTKPGEGELADLVVEEMENRVGDIAFLKGVERQLDRFADLYSLHAPTKVAFTDPSGQHQAEVTDALRTSVVAELINGLGGGVVEDEPDDLTD
jgi:hypothetical protein